MSSPDHSTVDAIVLAGTHDSLVVEYQGRRLGKAFLPLGGCSLVGRVVQELLVARGVGRVFVAGPTEFLEESLAILSARQRGRVEIVAENPSQEQQSRCRVFLQDILGFYAEDLSSSSTYPFPLQMKRKIRMGNRERP